jgi:hypothetical protein
LKIELNTAIFLLKILSISIRSASVYPSAAEMVFGYNNSIK